MNNFPNMDEITNKLKDNIDFPASKEQIVNTAEKVPGIPEQAQQFLKDKLPDGEYGSIDDVKNAVGL